MLDHQRRHLEGKFTADQPHYFSWNSSGEGQVKEMIVCIRFSGWWLFFFIINYLVKSVKFQQNMTLMKNNSSGPRAVNSHVEAACLIIQQFKLSDFNYIFILLRILFLLFKILSGNLKI